MLTQTIPCLIRRLTSWRPDGFTLLLMSISLLGVGFVLLREATYGAAFSWDSVAYIAAAQSTLAGEGFVDFRGEHFTAYPPLYPLILAAASLFVFDPRDVAGPVNAAVFGLTVFIVGRWLRQSLQSKFLVLWGSLALAISIPLAWTAYWVWSETLFIMLVTLALVWTDRFMRDDRGVQLIAVAAFTALACLTRYMGVALVGAVILLLIFQHGAAVPQKLRRMAVYSLISLAPIGLWMLRNFLLVGSLTGKREGKPGYAIDILGDMHEVAQTWLFLDLLSDSAELLPLFITNLAMIGLAMAVGYVLIVSLRRAEMWNIWRPFCVAGIFALAYIFCLIVAIMARTVGHGVEVRYLAPVYLPLMFAGLFALDRFLIYAQRRRQPSSAGIPSVARTFLMRGKVETARRLPWVTIIAALSLCLWLGYSTILHIREIEIANTHGHGYRDSKWANSEVLEYLRTASIDSVIITNASVVTYIHAGHTDSPYRHRDLEKSQSELKEQLARAADGDYVVWFYDKYIGSYYGYSAMFLRAMPALVPVAELTDGIVFKVYKSGER